MKSVNVILEYRFYKVSTGEVYTDASFDYEFWKRYLLVFKSVTIIARAKLVNKEDIGAKWKPVLGENVYFETVPYYHGFGELVKRIVTIGKAIRNISLSNDSIYLFRMPSILAVIFFSVNRKMWKKSYGIEMVGDPEEVFASFPAHYRLIGKFFISKTRSIIKNARSAAYVEKVVLPKKYPAVNAKGVFYFSSINLPDNEILKDGRVFAEGKGKLKIVSIGSLDQMYKGPDILLKALQICKANGMSFSMDWIGGGVYIDKMINLAKELDLTAEVSFLGMLAERKLINQYMDSADIFVLASRTEGLPRAMIEAMSRGLPCIGTRVGGIPELLTDDYLLEKGDYQQLAQKLLAIANDKQQLNTMSKQNVKTAERYSNSRLNIERQGFYQTLLNSNK